MLEATVEEKVALKVKAAAQVAPVAPVAPAAPVVAAKAAAAKAAVTPAKAAATKVVVRQLVREWDPKVNLVVHSLYLTEQDLTHE